MIFSLLTLLAALAVAAVTEWFSVAGIMAIYSGAPLNAALIMGLVLGGAKLVSISWLYRNWSHATWFIKLPLMYFTLALMVVSSVGVYGFLTKAHLEQGAATVNNSAKIERLDQQIAREKSSIADNEKVIAQLDTAINSFLGNDKADRALSVRKSQAPQRKQLREDISASQKLIDSFSEERLVLTSQVRAVELETGPIKYIAKLFYGSGGDEAAKMNAAVVIFTLLIVSTLDPLAVILLIAANHTLLRLQNEKNQKAAETAKVYPVTHNLNNQAPLKEDVCPSAIVSNTKIAEVDEEIPAEKVEKVDIDEEIATLETPQTEYATENRPQTVDSEHDKDEERSATVEHVVEPTVPEKATEILSEEENTKLEGNDEYVSEAIVQSPARASTTGSTVETAIRVQTKAPVLEQVYTDAVIREIIGNQPHFIPQKLNEEAKSTDMEAAREPTNDPGPVTEDVSEITVTEETQAVEESRPGPIQEDNDEAELVRKEQDAATSHNKYPISLSWLKEFKGN